MNTELGHFPPQVRLNAGLRLLAMSGDHETEPWAYRRKTRHSTDEWIQRRMARNLAHERDFNALSAQMSDPDIAMDQGHELATETEWDREAFNAEFRIWDDEQRAVRAVQQLGKHHARQKKWHDSREARRHLWAIRPAGQRAGVLREDPEILELLQELDLLEP